MMELMLPALVSGPPKLFQVITEFKNYRYFLLEGGRNGGKSQFVARLLLYLGDIFKLNIVCGREVQNKIEESVYTLLKEIILEFNLPYKIMSNKIVHYTNGTVFNFRGFQGLSAEDIKGLQGVDILWVDEAQSLQKRSVTNIIPTIRKDTSKLIFTMNRFLVSDPVYDDMIGRKNCLHINVSYLDNPYCPLSQIAEAETCKERSEKEYNHIWLGMPLPSAEDYLFDAFKLHKSFEIYPEGDLWSPCRVLSVDFAAQGSDKCVATVLDRVTQQHWKITQRVVWDEPDAMVSVGRIVSMIGEFNPDINILDCGGMGHVVWNRLNEVFKDTNVEVHRFDGGSTEHVNTKDYANQRAEGYYITREFFDSGFLCMDKKDEVVIKELEKIRMKYRSSGQRLILPKEQMRLDEGYSPDNADSLMMALWAIRKYMGLVKTYAAANAPKIKRVSGSRRRNRL